MDSEFRCPENYRLRDIRLPSLLLHGHADGMSQSNLNPPEVSSGYWRSNLKILGFVLSVWFFVSFGCGIVFKDFLDQFSIGGAPLGFWMAQQGSILFFVLLLLLYSCLMNKLDDRHGYGEEE